MRRRRAGIRAVVAVAALGLAGCTGGVDRTSTPTVPGAPTSTTTASEPVAARSSSPFAADAVPEGFELVVADVGSSGPSWDWDLGSDEPFATLLPEGSDDPDDLVWVLARPLEPDDAPAIVDPEPYVYGEGRWAELEDRTRAEVEVAVRGPARHRDVFATLLAGTTVDVGDHARAPEVHDVPDGWRLLGHVDADLLVAVQAWLDPESDRVPGMPTAHTLVWHGLADVRGEVPELSALTLPGEAADLEAVVGLARPDRSTVRPVPGREGFVVDEPTLGRTTVVLRAPWDDLVVVTVHGAGTSVEELVALAASVREVGDDAWEDQRRAAFGGHGALAADPGRVVLARGEHDGVGWLLQDDGAGRADRCLRLSTLRRECLEWFAGSEDTYSAPADRGSAVGPLHLVAVSGPDPAAVALRLTAGGEVQEAPLVAVPGGTQAVAVFTGVELPATALPICRPERPPPADLTVPVTLTEVRVDLLDARGAPIGCFDPYGPT